MAQLEKRVASAQPKAKRAAPAPRKRRSREIDPGDAVPEGVAVQEPAPLDEVVEKLGGPPAPKGEPDGQG